MKVQFELEEQEASRLVIIIGEHIERTAKELNEAAEYLLDDRLSIKDRITARTKVEQLAITSGEAEQLFKTLMNRLEEHRKKTIDNR